MTSPVINKSTDNGELYACNLLIISRYKLHPNPSIDSDLALVDVVVGVDRHLGAHLTSHYFYCSVADHFIHIHVGLSTGASLPNHQREMVL